MTDELARSHAEATIEHFRQDPPSLAADYLDAILQDGDEAELLQALQRLAEAFGGVGEIAKRADVMRSLYIAHCRRKAIRK
jgi:DNA-binding phage protein